MVDEPAEFVAHPSVVSGEDEVGVPHRIEFRSDRSRFAGVACADQHEAFVLLLHPVQQVGVAVHHSTCHVVLDLSHVPRLDPGGINRAGVPCRTTARNSRLPRFANYLVHGSFSSFGVIERRRHNDHLCLNNTVI